MLQWDSVFTILFWGEKRGVGHKPKNKNKNEKPIYQQSGFTVLGHLCFNKLPLREKKNDKIIS